MIIIAHGGQEFAIGGQRNRRIWPALIFEPAQKFRGQVCRVRRAAAVAANQQFFTGNQAVREQVNRALERFLQRGKAAQGDDGFFNGPLQVTHGGN